VAIGRWLTGTAAGVALLGLLHPIAGMLFAYWILAEVPTIQQAIGSIILRSGLLLSQVKSDRQW
jgi:drug/metabolite transporter (DMT)-like permease